MALDDKKILVVGGTVLLGQPVALALVKFGFPVRILTRDSDRARKIFGEAVEICQGDIFDLTSLAAAIDGCYGIHINLKGGPAPKDFDRIEHQGTAAIVKAATAKGIKKITYLSGSSVAKERSWFPATRAKLKAEQAVIDSGLDYTIFRATWFMESLPFFVRDRQATVMGRQPHKYHWLAAEDYAKMVARSYLLDEAIGKTLTVWGPDAYTFEEALEIYCQQVDPEIRVTRVPLGVLSFFALITFSRPLKEILPLMRYFEKIGEAGDPAETDEILGGPTITLKQWCANFAGMPGQQNRPRLS